MMAVKNTPFYYPVYKYNSLKLKGQCIDIEATQSRVISQPVKSLVKVKRGFTRFCRI